MSFINEYPELQQIARELLFIHSYNSRAADNKLTQLLITEGVLCSVFIDKFLRAVLGKKADPRYSVRDLLDVATIKELNLLSLTAPEVMEDLQDFSEEGTIFYISCLYNAFIKSDYSEIIKYSGAENYSSYLQINLPIDISAYFMIVSHLVDQVDAKTGLSYSR